MATFTPPFVDGNPMFFKGATDKANRLMRHYGSWATGVTIWRDSGGVWHQSLVPYLGGATHTVHDRDTTTVSAEDEGLANAEVVYQGGHVYEIDKAAATALVSAGYDVHATNKLTGPCSFETGVGIWTTGTASVLRVQSNEQSSHGFYSAKLTRPNTTGPFQLFAASAASTTLTVSPGDTVTFMFDVFFEATHTPQVTFRYYDAGKSIVANDVVVGSAVPAGVWTTVRLSAPAAPSGAVFLNPAIQTQGSALVGENMYVDKVAIDHSPFTLWAEGAVL